MLNPTRSIWPAIRSFSCGEDWKPGLFGGGLMLMRLLLCLFLGHVGVGHVFGSSVVRNVSTSFLPGSLVEVTLECEPTVGILVHAWEETPPQGWVIESISDSGFLDPISGKIKWGLFLDDLSRKVSYRLRVPQNPTRHVEWVGQAVFDGEVVSTTGDFASDLPGSKITRALPDFYVAGGSFNLTLTVTPDPLVKVYAVEEQLPEGWTASQFSSGGVLDPATRRMKWGPFFDGQSRVLTCRLGIPVGESKSIAWNGVGRFNDLEVNIEGAELLDRQSCRVERILPSLHAPAIAFTVTNVTFPASWVRVYAVEDRIPTGWTAANISDGGTWDAQTGKVKWGPFNDGLARRLTYNVIPNLVDEDFQGLASFNETQVAITGNSTTLLDRTRVIRSAPDFFLPGVRLSITNRTDPGPGIHVHAVEDVLPEGWRVESLNEGGVYDSINRKLKWGPFNDSVARTLVAVVTPGRSDALEVELRGKGWDDFGEVVIEGANAIKRLQSVVARTLPASATFGQIFQVKIEVTPTPDVRVHALEEVPPAGWIVSAVSDQGVFDASTGKVKWGPFSDAQKRVLTYSLLPPTPSRATTITGLFEGHGLFDTLEVPILGDGFVRATGTVAQEVRLTIVQVDVNRVEVTVFGVAGVGYSVQKSTDLVSWSPWRSGVADSAGKLPLAELISLGGAFYRVAGP